VPALVGMSAIYLKREDTASALDYAERAVKAAPADFSAHVALGRVLLATEEPAKAATELEAAVKLAPASPEARLSLANAYMNDTKSAFAELDRAQGFAPQSRIDLIRAFGYAVEGKKAEALQLVHKWDKPVGGIFVRSTSIAAVYAWLGDREQMYTWLDKAYADRDGMLAFTNEQGCYRRYRSEPRFIALEEKLGLPTAK